MIYSAHDVAGLGTILSIWAHPDDESWCMGGLLAQASKNGQRVICVTATCGEAGLTSDEQRWPQAKLGDIRRKELKESLSILGVTEHTWLECNDGELAAMVSTHCIARLKRIIADIRPDSIFTFGSDGLTGHSDHKAVHNWTKQAIKEASSRAALYCVMELEDHYKLPACQSADDKFKIFLENTKPKTISEEDAAIVFHLTEETKDKKFRALQAHTCQMDRFMKDTDGYNFVLSLCDKEAFVKEPRL